MSTVTEKAPCVWQENMHGERYSPDYNVSFAQTPSTSVFQQYIDHHLNEENTLYIILGTDSGLLPKYVETRFAQQGSRFIFIEEAQLLSQLDHDYDVLSYDNIKQQLMQGDTDRLINQRQLIYVAEDPFDLELIVASLLFGDYLLNHRVKMVKSVGLAEKPQNQLAKRADDYMSQLGSFQINNSASQYRFFMDATFKAAQDMLLPLTHLKNKLQGKTFVLLGGSPSVSLIFPWLRQHRDDIIVMAAGRIADRLYQENINPDFFLTVDPQSLVLGQSKHLYQFKDNSILITSNHPSPKVMAQWPGKSFYAGHRLVFDKSNPLEVENIGSAGPTVMNFALMAAGYLGAGRAILSGVDLCFDPRGQSHEESSAESRLGRYLQQAEAKVMTYAGIEATTNIHMYQAAEALRAQATWLQGQLPQFEMININPYAIAVDEIKCLSVEDLPAIEQPVTQQDRADIWQSATVDKIKQRKILKNNVIKPTQAYLRTLNDVHQRAQKALAHLAKITDKQQSDFNQLVDKVVKQRQKIEQTLGDNLYVLFNYSFNDYRQLAFYQQQDESLQGLVDTLTSYFSSVALSSQNFVAVLEEIVHKTQWRMKELDSSQLTQQLFEYWLAEQEAGRGAVWLNQQTDAHLSAEEQQRLEQLNRVFAQALIDAVPVSLSAKARQEKQLIALWSYVVKAVKEQDKARIEDIVGYIADFKGEDYTQLTLFLQAHIAALEADWHASNELIAQINHSRLIISALRLKSDNALKLDDRVMLLETLEDLAVFDVYYYYMLANVANQLGLLELAGNAYMRYLQVRPQDKLALWDYWHWLQPQADVAAIQDMLAFMTHHQIEDDALAQALLNCLAKLSESETSLNDE